MQYRAAGAKQEEEEEEEGARGGGAHLGGLFKETSRGQSWLTQFSATSVELRIEAKERGEKWEEEEKCGVGGVTMSPGINKRA